MVSPLLLSSAWSSIAASALGKGLQACHAVSQHLLHVISSCGKDTCHSHSGSSTAATRPSCNGRPAHGSSWNLVQHNRPAETPTYRTLLHDSVCSADALSFAQARRQYNTSSSSEARSSSKSRSRGWPAVASRGAAKTLHQRNQVRQNAESAAKPSTALQHCNNSKSAPEPSRSVSLLAISSLLVQLLLAVSLGPCTLGACLCISSNIQERPAKKGKFSKTMTAEGFQVFVAASYK